jgi:hypothetical protein
MRKVYLGTALAIMATPLMELPASAATCVTASVATYTASNFSCNVGGVTFSDISVVPTASNGGSVTLTEFVPTTLVDTSGDTEYGLELIYSSNTGSGYNGTADVAWLYTVSGSLLSDAYVSLAGTVTGTGIINVGETLSNGVTLSLSGAGSTSTTYAPIGQLGVIKDQDDFAGSAGTADSSVLVNAFSLTSTPLPGTLPLLATGLVGLWGFGRKRSKQSQLGCDLAS